MIKDALQYIIGLKEPHIEEINGDIYADREMHRIDTYYPKARALELNTLTSLVDYIKAHVDKMADKMIIHVVSPTTVKMCSQLNDNREREYMVDVSAFVPSFRYENFIDHESFVINAQAKFLDDPKTDKAILLKFAGTVEAGSIATYGDDGVTQKATVKNGIASKTDDIVPNPVKLRPYRTFIEVEQPVSEFIFRMKADKYDGILCALFEADGGAWKNEAMKNIKEYLESELAEYKEQFIIIS